MKKTILFLGLLCFAFTHARLVENLDETYGNDGIDVKSVYKNDYNYDLYGATGPNSDIDNTKIIEDKLATVNLHVTYNFTVFINNYNTKDDAITDLNLQLSEFFAIDKKRVNVTDVTEGSVSIDFILYPRLTNLDITTQDILNKYNNGGYVSTSWLSASTITYTINNAYKCVDGDIAPQNYVCVYNYEFTVLPENSNERKYKIITTVLSLFFAFACIYGILSAIRYCVNRARNTVNKRQRTQIAIQTLKSDFV